VRVLVTGATGFIGTTLCRELVIRGHTVMGASRRVSQSSEIERSLGHISYEIGRPLPASIKEFSPEIVVNLAWNGIPDFSAATCFENVSNQISFLTELAKLPNLKKILVAGSCKEYGARFGRCLERERSLPDGYFSWAKQTLSDYFHVFCEEKDIDLLWYRIFYVYGPGQRRGSLVPSLINALRNGEMPEIKNPKAANDFVYIDDVINAFAKGLEREGVRGIFNLGSGRLATVGEVSNLVNQAIQGGTMQASQAGSNPSSDESQTGLYADIEKARLQLDWAPTTSLQEGVRQTLGASS
jgi:UDP-glucose 4-epimerase